MSRRMSSQRHAELRQYFYTSIAPRLQAFMAADEIAEVNFKKAGEKVNTLDWLKRKLPAADYAEYCRMEGISNDQDQPEDLDEYDDAEDDEEEFEENEAAGYETNALDNPPAFKGMPKPGGRMVEDVRSGRYGNDAKLALDQHTRNVRAFRRANARYNGNLTRIKVL